MSARIADMLREKAQLEADIARALREDYPVDGPISWSGFVYEGVCLGVVVRHTYGERIFVRNTRTGGERTIKASRIVG